MNRMIVTNNKGTEGKKKNRTENRGKNRGSKKNTYENRMNAKKEGVKGKMKWMNEEWSGGGVNL